MARKKKERKPPGEVGQSRYALKVARRRKEAREAGEHDLPYPVLRSTEEAKPEDVSRSVPIEELQEWGAS